jgi:hypothetical protein
VSLDRAIELCKAAKQYVSWMMSAEGSHREWKGIQFQRNNHSGFSITNNTNAGVINEVASKPKNPDSCRGDAPKAAFFDEIGFIEEKFWYKFALPLLQVTERICTCTTTPPPADGFFAVFVDKIKDRNAIGDNFFFLENHSLACRSCIESQEATECCHNLHYVPPWKSLMRFGQMKSLIPARQMATFQSEVFGVLSQQDATYFPAKLVDAFVRRERLRKRYKNDFVPTIWVGVDPAGHQKSEMGLTAMFICCDTGMVVIIGLASVSVAQCEVSEIQAIVSVFVKRVRAHPNVHRLSPICPITETNNNEVFAMSIVRCFTPPVWMPFTAAKFKSHITPGIGVLTTHDNKQAMVQQMFSHLVDGRIVLAASVATVGRSDLDARLPIIPVTEQIQSLADQLKRFKDQADGSISGKNESSGDNDDVAMALLMAVYWSLAVRASEPRC